MQIDGETVQISYAQIRRIEKDGKAGRATARTLAALLGVDLAQLRPYDPRHGSCGLPREVSVDFVGRQAQIEAVLGILLREGSARIAASVEGLPGIGKTELALQVCGHAERTRAFRIFWFNAENPDLTAQWADVVAPHFGVEHADAAERAQLAVRTVAALAEPTLVVLDNAQHWSASQPWPRPQGNHIRWLVTTRLSGLGDRALEHVELPVLDPGSARELLVRISGADVARRPGFEALIAHLDGYTIALELAASFLARYPEVTPAEYLELLSQGQGDQLEEEVQTRAPYQQTLERALELLWQRSPRALRAGLGARRHLLR